MYKKIEENLNNVLKHAYFPELEMAGSGKVRENYKIKDKLLMITTDRISCFDRILKQCIPYKGNVLNEISRHFFRNTAVKHAALNALPTKNPVHPNVTLAEYVTPIRLEMVVRGYVAGSLSREYKKGRRKFFETKLKNGMKPYQELGDLLITPTTKAEAGHDIELKTKKEAAGLIAKSFSISLEEAEQIYKAMEDKSKTLFEEGTRLSRKGNLILADTKYEFGLSKSKELMLIDEVHTPDSSRYWRTEDYKKGKPEEWSKEYVRQYLMGKGFSGEGQTPDLPKEVIAETSKRYIDIYERIVGRFELYEDPVQQSLVRALKKQGYTPGLLSIIIMGSETDMEHSYRLREELNKYGIPAIFRVASAHRNPSMVERIVEEYNKNLEPTVIISVAGGLDALSGTISSLSQHLVISCPPYHKTPQENQWITNQYLGNPKGSSCAFIPRRENAAKAAAQHFSLLQHPQKD